MDIRARKVRLAGGWYLLFFRPALVLRRKMHPTTLIRRSRILAAIFFLSPIAAMAQESREEGMKTEIAVLFGLTQPIFARGFNIEGDISYRRFIFDYSHGMSLDFSGRTVTESFRRQNLAVHMPFTTGFGIGYRFTDFLNIRLEPKWHRFEIGYEGQGQQGSGRIVEYDTFSLGLGAYGNWRPLKSHGKGLAGLTVAPSLRFWPTLWSSLPGDEIQYDNIYTGKRETHHRMNPGIANTPLIVNVSVGYSLNAP